ncbi:uncharacterized protein [Mobula birostris]|uniref:uncharacterized protein n=1 Tax=Mobula birostris TaxID=1983395 RepID=UPI003B27E878
MSGSRLVQSSRQRGSGRNVPVKAEVALFGSGRRRRKMKRRCNVLCYGQGDVHKKIVKKLKITQYEEPDIPYVLFVYSVSRETEDLRNALQWVTEKQGERREDICAVVLLEKSLDKQSKPEYVAHQGMFDDKTVVVRILWKQEKNSASKIRKGPKSNSEAMKKIKESIKECQKTGMLMSGYQISQSSRQQGSGQNVPVKAEVALFGSGRRRRKMKRRCNVLCYGQGDVHKKIVKKLKITQCEEPDIPYVLFVYSVSRETEDLRNALQWVTEKRGERREDICAVVLLEKSLDKQSKPEYVAHPGTFDDKTVVVRILWKQEKNSASKIRKGPKSNSEAMKKIKESIKECQKNPRVSDSGKLS